MVHIIREAKGFATPEIDNYDSKLLSMTLPINPCPSNQREALKPVPIDKNDGMQKS